MTTLYLFRGTTGTAMMLTDDRSGGKLPPHPVGSWVFLRNIEVKPGGGPLIAGDSDDLLAKIAADGYHRWPEDSPSI